MASRQVAFHRATNEAVTAALQLEEEQRVTRALEREVARLEGTIARRGRRPRRSADEAPRVMRRVQGWPSTIAATTSSAPSPPSRASPANFPSSLRQPTSPASTYPASTLSLSKDSPPSARSSPTSTARPKFVVSALGLRSKHLGGTQQMEGVRRLGTLQLGQRRRNRMRALNRAEERLHDSERAFATLKGDAEQQLEFYNSAIAKREAEIAASKKALATIELGVPSIMDQMHRLKTLVNMSSTIFTTEHKSHREFAKLQNKISQISNQVENVEQGLLESAQSDLGCKVVATPTQFLTVVEDKGQAGGNPRTGGASPAATVIAGDDSGVIDATPMAAAVAAALPGGIPPPLPDDIDVLHQVFDHFCTLSSGIDSPQQSSTSFYWKRLAKNLNHNGISLNQFGQLLHSVGLFNHRLTLCDVEAIFNRSIYTWEDEQYMLTGKRKVFEHLPFKPFCYALTEACRTRSRWPLDSSSSDMDSSSSSTSAASSTHYIVTDMNDESKAILSQVVAEVLVPWLKGHATRGESAGSTLSRTVASVCAAIDRQREQTNKSSKIRSTAVWMYGAYFKHRIYCKDMLSMLGINATDSWMRRLYCLHAGTAAWDTGPDSLFSESYRSEQLQQRSQTELLGKRLQRVLGESLHEEEMGVVMRTTAKTPNSETGELTMNEYGFSNVCRDGGIVPMLMSSNDMDKLWRWITSVITAPDFSESKDLDDVSRKKSGAAHGYEEDTASFWHARRRRKMYFAQFQQAMLAVGLFVWERRGRQSCNSGLRREMEQSRLKSQVHCVRWVLERIDKALKVGPKG